MKRKNPIKLYVWNDSPYFEKIEYYEQPEAIVVSFPDIFFKEYPGGEDAFNELMDEINVNERLYWNNTISNLPTLPVDFIFLAYHGKVQLRLTILQYERNVSKRFAGNRTFPNKNWVICGGPVEKAPKDFYIKGFQGFRYTELIF